MNIKITHNWLLEYLKTQEDPYSLAKYLSLAGPSVERVEKKGEDFVYEIEITSNRIDTASVWGIAQEAQAILPFFGKKAKLLKDPYKDLYFSSLSKLPSSPEKENLNVVIKDKDLCSRFTAIMIKGVRIGPSPSFIRKRLKAIGEKSINNLVDISNYLMFELGQPSHIFDLDKIGKKTMIMRKSKKGEKIITLDGREITLPGEDIVIKDGEGELIDLCGIMGGKNSAISKNTKNILVFVQTYNKQKIRRTSMITGQRTVASTYFEKGLDEERVEPTLVKLVEMIIKYGGGEIASQLYDIYPNPYKEKFVTITQSEIDRKIGVKIEEEKILKILKKLGFEVKKDNKIYNVGIPPFRKNDIFIKEDIVEEIARIYGYNNIPLNLPTTTYVSQPPQVALLFKYLGKTKYFLKHLSLNEVMNYSMISKRLIESLGDNLNNYLEIENTISDEIRFLRISLLPSLLKNIKENEGKVEPIKIFEIAKVYLKRKGDLPEEEHRLGIATNTDFFELKGIVEAILQELNVEGARFIPVDSDGLLEKKADLHLFVKDEYIGKLGRLSCELRAKLGFKTNVFLAELEFDKLVTKFHPIGKVGNIIPYAIIKLDYTFSLSNNLNYEKIRTTAKTLLKNLISMEVIDIFKNKATIRFYFQAKDKNLTEEEAKSELQKLVNSI